MLPEAEMQKKGIAQQVIDRVIRLRDTYNYILRNPLLKDREYIDYITQRYQPNGKPLSRSKAYEDLQILHAIVGNMQQCTKEWHRWRLNSMIAEGYAIAVREDDATAIAKLANVYGKYNQLDKNDERDNCLSEVPHISFVFDVSVMGFTPLANPYKEIDKLIKYYGGTPFSNFVEDADAVELLNDMEHYDKTAAISQ